MPFFLTYAEFVVATGAAIFFGTADPQPKPANTSRDVVLTFGTAVQRGAAPGEVFLTATLRPDTVIWNEYSAIYAAGLSDEGAAFVSAGFGKRLAIGPFEVVPFIGPALYQKDLRDGFSETELLQFRTGFDVSTTLGKNLTVTGGFYHLSNMQINADSADIDVAHAGVVFRF